MQKLTKLENLISLGHRGLIYTFLGKGYVDAVAAHEESVVQYMKDYDTSFRILEDPLMVVGIGVAFAKDDDGGICEQISKTLEEMRQDGTSLKIIGKYLDDPQKYLDVDKREEQTDVSEKSIKGLHILLVEDNELNMEIAEFMLQNEGAEVTKAWNGQEAVELFRKSEPGEFDAILMDIMMPVMNGYEATKMIRSLDREDVKEIPIIAMTANAFTEDRIRAKEAGMDEHISKPVDVELLIKIIHRFVEQ